MSFKSGFFFVAALCATTNALAAAAPVHGEVMALGTPAPPLHVVRLDGKPMPGWNSLRGKVVVVDFWASWCTPCIAAFPTFNNLVARYASKGVMFFSITYEPANGVAPLLEKHPLHTTIAIDDDFQGFRAYNAWGIPVVYIFDRDGKLAGVTHPDHLNSRVIDDVLAKRKLDVAPSTPWSDPKGAEDYFRSLQQEMKKAPR